MEPVRHNSRLLNLLPYKTSETVEISVENALNIMSFVALTYGDALYTVYLSYKPMGSLSLYYYFLFSVDYLLYKF